MTDQSQVDSDNRDNISDLDDLNATCVPPRKKKTTLQPPGVPDTSRASSKTASSTIYQFVEHFGRTFHRYKEGSVCCRPASLDAKHTRIPVDPSRISPAQ